MDGNLIMKILASFCGVAFIAMMIYLGKVLPMLGTFKDKNKNAKI